MFISKKEKAALLHRFTDLENRVARLEANNKMIVDFGIYSNRYKTVKHVLYALLDYLKLDTHIVSEQPEKVILTKIKPQRRSK